MRWPARNPVRCLALTPAQRPGLTRILQFLEREKLVKRSSDASDQRRSVFVLTRKGQQLYDEVGPDSEYLYAEIEKQFGAEKLESLYELLAEFYTVLSIEESAQ